jgi:hypothetical protein
MVDISASLHRRLTEISNRFRAQGISPEITGRLAAKRDELVELAHKKIERDLYDYWFGELVNGKALRANTVESFVTELRNVERILPKHLIPKRVPDIAALRARHAREYAEALLAHARKHVLRLSPYHFTLAIKDVEEALVAANLILHDIGSSDKEIRLLIHRNERRSQRRTKKSKRRTKRPA